MSPEELADEKNAVRQMTEILAEYASEIERLKTALKEVGNVLGTGQCTVPNCPGCHIEMEEAVSIARDALADATAPTEPTG